MAITLSSFSETGAERYSHYPRTGIMAIVWALIGPERYSHYPRTEIMAIVWARIGPERYRHYPRTQIMAITLGKELGGSEHQGPTLPDHRRRPLQLQQLPV